MKKVTKLVYGLSACLLLTFVGCNNETEEVTPKAVAEKIAITAMEVPADVIEGIANNEMTVVTADNKDEIETELKEALKSEDLSGIFNSFEDSEIVESSRSIAYEDLASLGEEYAQKMSEFAEALEKNGSASMTFSKTPGQVTGLKEGMDLSIPLIFIDMKVASTGSQMKSTMTQSSVIAVGANVGFDFTKFEEFEDFFFKNIKTGIASNMTSVITSSIDMSDIDLDNLSPDMDQIPEMKVTGSVNLDCNYSVGGVFVTKNNVAGKILVTADIKMNTKDISGLYGSDFNEDDMEYDITDYITAKLDVKVYDFEGKEVCTLVDTSDIEEISEFISFSTIFESLPSQGL